MKRSRPHTLDAYASHAAAVSASATTCEQAHDQITRSQKSKSCLQEPSLCHRGDVGGFCRGCGTARNGKL